MGEVLGLGPDRSIASISAGINLLAALIFFSYVRGGLRSWSVAPTVPDRIATLICAAVGLLSVIGAVAVVVPPHFHREGGPWIRLLWLAQAFVGVGAAALFLALCRGVAALGRTSRLDFPTFGGVVYLGIGAGLAVVASIPSGLRDTLQIALWIYLTGSIVAGGMAVLPVARPGAWRPGASDVPQRADLAVTIAITLCMSAIVWLHLSGGWNRHEDALNLLLSLLGLLLAIPFAVRRLGQVLEEVARVLLLLAVLLLVAFAFAGLGGWLAARDLRALGWVFGAIALMLVLGPVEEWVRALIGHLLRTLGRTRQGHLRAIVHQLSPALGVEECCRRVLTEIVSALGSPGAAILLVDGRSLAVGRIDVSALSRVWPDAEEVVLLPMGRSAELLRHRVPAALREALIEADVSGALAIRGAKRLWGFLLLRTRLAAFYDDQDDEAGLALRDQLGLVLDAADLLDRTLRAERSLAHAEKLSAIGEMAARIAHEIRNPVAAARSLTQQLAADPGEPHREELSIVLGELDRIERQVADLLRFSRREDLTVAPVDLAALVRATMEDLRGRLAAGDIAAAVEAPGDVVVRADRERLRQVLVNLIENAADALADRSDARRIDVDIARVDGTLRLRIADNGPGIPAELQARIFEPFFSSKSHGTGLGLAIAQRIVAAHGGWIAVRSGEPAGTVFEIELPAISEP